MAGMLVFSEKCPYCLEVLNFIKDHPVLIPIIKTHNINRQGVPEGVKRVPLIVTSSGEKHVGVEVLRWLEAMIPTNFEGGWCSTCNGSSFDEPFDEIGDGFPLDAYGISLSPPLTRDLQKKIDRSVNEAYADIKKNVNS
jgi:hypothetical protein